MSLNALLTGRAAKAGIVTTHGFGDTLEIGRMRRQTSGLSETEVTDYFLHNRYLPIVPRDLIVEVIERIDANGTVIAPLDEAQARGELRALKAKGVEALAICTLWSTANPVHERRLAELVGRGVAGCLHHAFARDLLRGRRIRTHVDRRRQRRARPDRGALSGAA